MIGITSIDELGASTTYQEAVMRARLGKYGVSDGVLDYLAENTTVTLSATIGLVPSTRVGSAPSAGGSTRTIANPITGDVSSYNGIGLVQGRSVRGTVDVTVYSSGAINKEAAFVKGAICYGRGLGGCFTVNSGQGETEIVVSGGAVSGYSRSVLVGEQYGLE